MSFKKFGYLLTGFGIFTVSLSFVVDFLGIGKAGIQSAQLLGIVLGVLLMATGLGFLNLQQAETVNFKNSIIGLYERLLNLPPVVWVVLGFVIAYVFLFIFPMFFNPDHRLQYFNRYIPDKFPLGLDLATIDESIKTWLTTTQGPYQNADIFYPPLHHVLLAPLLLLNYPQNYYFVVAIILTSLFILSFLIPLWMNGKRDFAIPLFFLITALFSYGLQFEMERGQFNVITFMLCMLSVYLFYFHRAFRVLAYILFSFSVQLRLYPAIFIVMFVDDWSAWKMNLKRIFGIGALNIALLFVLGYSVLIDFFQAVSGRLGTATWTWVGNHSIAAFVYNLTTSGFGLFDPDTLTWLQAHSTFISAGLLIYFLICFLALILRDYLNKSRGLNPDLLLICTLGGMMIPSVSHDYKLALLAGPMAVALSNRKIAAADWRKVLSAILIILASLSYSITLFPFKYRPEYLESSFPALFFILTAMTLLSFIAPPEYLKAAMDDGPKTMDNG